MGLENIDHVFVLMLENRSFDHLLGYSGITGVDAVTGAATAIDGLLPNGATNPDSQGTAYSTSLQAPDSMPEDPPHEFDFVRLQLLGSQDPAVTYANTAITNSGFVRSYATVAKGNPLGDILGCFAPDELPVMNALAREFCVCDRWFSSLPGPTIPNRLFLHAATSGGDPSNPSTLSLIAAMADGNASYKFLNGNVFQRMTARGIPWVIYHGDDFAMAYCLEGVRFGSGKPFDPRDAAQLARFRQDLESPNLPSYIFLEPNWGNMVLGTYKGGNSQHPMDSVASGEGLLKAVYEAVRASSCWERSVLIVTYDEHGGFFDHALPPAGVPAPGDVAGKSNFDFTQLGVRVPALIISPWIPRNRIDHTVYDHTSVLATLRRRFPDLGSFTARDAAAHDLAHLFSLPQPRTDAPQTLPESDFSVLPPPSPDPIATASEDALQNFPGASDPVTATQVGFLHAAVKRHLEMADPSEREQILQRVGTIQTNADLKKYLRDVKGILDAQPGNE